jgi:hypothetical protein
MSRPQQLWMRWCLSIAITFLLVTLLWVRPAIAWRHTLYESLPSGATNVQVRWTQLNRQSITYRIPPQWLLLDLYGRLEQHGWTRDGTESSSFTFAIFQRHRWFGRLSETATVEIPPGGSGPVQVRLIRCVLPAWQASC